VVLDRSMPRTDGFDVPLFRLILVISRFMQGALLQASELLGAAASLLKTEAPGLLVETVKTLPRPQGTAPAGSNPQARRYIV